LSWDLETDFFEDGLGHAFQNAVVLGENSAVLRQDATMFQEDGLNASKSLGSFSAQFDHFAISIAQLGHKARLILDQGS
jgi:hypothetical protein